MNLPEIDFTRIRSIGPAGQRAGFEQLMCEMVAQLPPSADAEFFSLHGDGGDGGVECFWRFPDETEVGYQAKYWTQPAAVDKTQLDNSVKTALTQHPKLTAYTIAIPTDPTGPTGGSGKSLYEKVYEPDGWLDGWKQAAANRGMGVEFKVLWKTNLITMLEDIDTSGVQRRYWFDIDVLPDLWWADRLESAVAVARPRYMPDLTIDVPAAQYIAALCSDEEWWTEIDQHANDLSDELEGVGRSSNKAAGADLTAVLDAGETVIAAIATWRDSRDAGARDRLIEAIGTAHGIAVEQAIAEADALSAEHGTWDSAGWRQFQAEYQVSFPAAAVDALRSLSDQFSGLNSFLTGPHGQLAGHQVAMMTGAAGMGKTYVAIDSAKRRYEAGKPSVLVHGRWFTDGDPLTQLRDCLQLPSDLSGEEMLALLDQAGRARGTTVLVVIDALNETQPRALWRDHLDRVAAAVARYPRLRLLLTARTHYVDQVLPTGFSAETFEHTGFEGVEFDAVSEYADHYGLEPPTSPPIHGEFDSPLYLRLVCEAFQKDGRLSLEQAAIGLNELVRMVLSNANDAISAQLGAPPNDRIVHRGIRALARAIADRGEPSLPRTTAHASLAPIWADQSAEKSLLEALIGHGLLEEDVRPDESPYGEDIITVTFERLMHHLIVLDALDGVTDAAGVAAELSTGRLRNLLRLGTADIDRGLLEATSVVVADQIAVELTEFHAEIGNDEALHSAIIAGTAWRSPGTITEVTREVFLVALTEGATASMAATMLFRLSARPNHPLNADHLHDLLASLDMAARDAFLAPWLYDTHNTHGAVDRLIRWARERPIDAVTAQTARLWIAALMWCTSATDRRVADPATIGAARLLRRHPRLAPGLLAKFLTVDDDWIVQRTCEVAYTALFAAGSPEDWRASAEVVWNAIFASDVPTNAGVRDAARSILESAAARRVLPVSVEPSDFRPPYDSRWPIDWPEADAIEALDTDQYPKLVHSATTDDFYIYQLSPALRGYDGVDLRVAARRIVLDVTKLGYDPDLHAAFDHEILETYGPGRGRPPWIERMGKKYQWIALSRLIGVVTDHMPRTPDPWDPPAPTVPGPQSDRLRHLDPTLVEPPADNPDPQPWVPAYDWDQVASATDVDWIADPTDLPDIAVDAAIRDGRPFVAVTGHYQWVDSPLRDHCTRQIWANLRPLLVRTADLATAVSELEGRSHASGYPAPMLLHGFVGEYPFGHHYREELRAHEHEVHQGLSVEVIHAAVNLLGEYDYAPDELGKVSLDAPAPRMFGAEPSGLTWNGRDGWVDSQGQTVAAVRHVRGGQQNELLMDKVWLEQWLTAESMSLIWLEITGKDPYNPYSDNYPGRLMRTAVRHWTPGDQLQTATPGFDRTSPHTPSQVTT